MSEEDTIKHILKGISEHCFQMLLAKNPQTVTDAIKLCQSYDKLIKQRALTRRSFGPDTSSLTGEFQFKKEAVICVYGTGFGNDLKFADAGLCDMTLLDSLYKDGRNPFEGPYEADVQHFLRNARDKKNDQFGLSIDFLNYRKLEQVVASTILYKIMDDFWNDRIFHYAMIDISPYTQSKSEVMEALNAMKKIDQVLQAQSIGRNQATFIILGFSPIGPDWKSFAWTILRTFTPDIFVLRGHYSLANHNKPGCKMAPPNIYKTMPDFPVSMEAAHEGLLELASQGHHCAWAVSMSAAGRWNRPLMGASLNWRDYEPFSPCERLPRDKKQLGTILDACIGVVYKRHPSSAYKTMFAFSTQIGLSVMYDSAETMREKLCNFKANMTNVKYGIAVFEAQYGDPDGLCQFGKFGRIAMAGRLVKYFSSKFKTGSDFTDCLLLPSS
ncbi:uncharacterized protein LOC144159889 [Haemaphysalis longicornis]